jgi:hypothetical protein
MNIVKIALFSFILRWSLPSARHFHIYICCLLTTNNRGNIWLCINNNLNSIGHSTNIRKFQKQKCQWSQQNDDCDVDYDRLSEDIVLYYECKNLYI